MPQLSGSLEISGSIIATGGITVSGSIASASYAQSSSLAANAELLSGRDVNRFATTGSNSFNGNQTVTGSLTVTGQVIAQTLNVQQVTSSVVYSSGSNVFGNNINNTHQFTGSVLVTGSLVASNISRTGGTSTQFLKADGSVDGTSYATAASISGTTNYIPKFTSASAIGNSDLRTNSGNDFGFGINPNYKLSIQGNSNSGIFLKQGGQIGSTISAANFYNGLVFENTATTNAWGIGYSQGAAFSVNYFDGASTYHKYLSIDNGGTVTLSGALNGTSLSMSGGGVFGGSATVASGAFGVGGLRLKEYTATDSRNWIIANDVALFGDIAFQQSTTQTGSTYNTRFYINPSGNVGIGTTSPFSSKLHVVRSESGANPTPVLRVGNSGSGFTSKIIITDETTNDGIISYVGSNQTLTFGLGGAPNILTLAASTGAATFSSSVTATSVSAGSGVEIASIGAGSLGFYNAASSNKWIKLSDDASTINAVGFIKSGSTATVWFPSGNVGIATTAPVAPLTIQASNNLNDNLILLYSNSTAAQAYVAIGSYFSNGNTNVNSQIRFGNEFASGAPAFLAFATGTSSATERMRITSDGKVLIGTTTDNGQLLQVNGTSLFHNTVAIGFTGVNVTANTPLYWNNSNGNIGINTSSIRYKKDVVSFTKEQAELALLLDPVFYTRKETNQREIGFIAEQVKEIGLDLIVPEIDGEPITVDYAKISVVAIAMIKELNKTVQSLRTELDLLKAAK